MKSMLIKAMIALSILAKSSSAFAYDDAALLIGRLVASTNSGGGYRVYPARFFSLPNTQGCSANDYAEMYGSAASVTEQVIMNNTLLAAYLGGRLVELRLDGCGSTGRPRYRIVAMAAGS